MNLNSPHIPVLVDEVCACLPAGNSPVTVVDGTFGYGGHYQAIAAKLENRLSRYFGIDQDATALSWFESHGPKNPALTLIRGDFRKMNELLPSQTQVDIVLLDLGVSTPQLTRGGRGMSVYSDDPLDMRLDTGTQTTTVSDVLKGHSEQELEEVIRVLTPYHSARKIAAALKRFALDGQLPKTSSALIRSVSPWLGSRSKSKTHPATALFMMLRILVNDEVGALEEAIPKSVRLLKSKGRLLIISFHGFEHRMIKQLLIEQSRYGKMLFKKPIRASRKEIQTNPSARSAQLRVFERL